MTASTAMQLPSESRAGASPSTHERRATTPVQQLRGQPYAVQAKALSPDAQPSFVQQEAKLKPADAPDGKAPVPTNSAPDANAPAEPAAPLLTDAEVAEAMAIYRKNPLPFEAVAAFQAKVKLAPTGVMDKPEVLAVAGIKLGPKPADDQAAPALQKKAKAKHVPKSKARFGVPDVAFMRSQGIEVEAVKPKFDKAGAGTKGSAPAEDAACQHLFGQSYNQYLGTLGKMTFLGRPVIGHNDLLARLAAAERFLHSKYSEANGDSATLGKRLGVTSVSHLRPSTESSDQMNHGIGFAIDLNPGTNPWVFGNTGRSTQNAAIPVVLERAAAFLGKGGSLTANKIAKMSKTMTTQELVAELGGADKNLEEYRALAKMDQSDLEALIDKRLGESPAVKKLGDKGFWKTKIPFDNLIMGKYIEDQASKAEKANHTGGFMDLQPIVIQAMRDVAGLRWGATDMGKESGDMMHFDGYGTIAKCNQVRGAIDVERKKMATPAPKGGDDKTKG